MLQALQIPLRVLGEVIGSVVIKPLQLLTRALGFLLRSIGRLVDKIPGVSGGPLIRAGQEMIDASHGMAGEFAATTKELEKMKGSLQNVPAIFDIALRRRQAALGGMPTGGGTATPRPPVTIHGGVTVQVVSGGRDESPRELADKIQEAFSYMSRTGQPLLLPA